VRSAGQQQRLRSGPQSDIQWQRAAGPWRQDTALDDPRAHMPSVWGTQQQAATGLQRAAQGATAPAACAVEHDGSSLPAQQQHPAGSEQQHAAALYYAHQRQQEVLLERHRQAALQQAAVEQRQLEAWRAQQQQQQQQQAVQQRQQEAALERRAHDVRQLEAAAAAAAAQQGATASSLGAQSGGRLQALEQLHVRQLCRLWEPMQQRPDQHSHEPATQQQELRQSSWQTPYTAHQSARQPMQQPHAATAHDRAEQPQHMPQLYGSRIRRESERSVAAADATDDAMEAASSPVEAAPAVCDQRPTQAAAPATAAASGCQDNAAMLAVWQRVSHDTEQSVSKSPGGSHANCAAAGGPAAGGAAEASHRPAPIRVPSWQPMRQLPSFDAAQLATLQRHLQRGARPQQQQPPQQHGSASRPQPTLQQPLRSLSLDFPLPPLPALASLGLDFPLPLDFQLPQSLAHLRSLSATQVLHILHMRIMVCKHPDAQQGGCAVHAPIVRGTSMS
jgi:hypothetical protein